MANVIFLVVLVFVLMVALGVWYYWLRSARSEEEL